MTTSNRLLTRTCFVGLLLLSLLSISISSCEPLEKEPTPVRSNLYFSGKGGNQVVKIRSNDGSELVLPWSFNELQVGNRLIPHQIDTLTSGEQRITSDLATFTISKDLKFVTIELFPNPTDQARVLYFQADGEAVGFVLRCHQEAGTPPAGQQ